MGDLCMLGIIKGDARYEELSKQMESIFSSELFDFIGVDALLLPFGGIDEYYNIKQSSLNLLDILKENDIKIIFVGNANKKLQELCQVKNIRLVELLKDKEFVKENAFLTAMGLIHFLNQERFVISDKRVLIIGYGYIGHALAELLKAYHCEFYIYPNQELEEKYISLNGYPLADFKNFDIAVNTIPSILDWDYECFKDKRIIDVASFPYGFDINKIYEYGIKYDVFGAIPSKFSPASAGKLIKKHIEKFL